MDSARRPCLISVCLSVLAATCLPCSGSPGPSLWGKKVVFMGRHCVWQLDKGCLVPPLEELSVCVHLHREIATSEWTGFVYKAPGERQVELGLAGRGGFLVAWLFGHQWSVPEDLPLKCWHNVCLTWSSHSERLRLYINGSSCLDAHVNATLPRRLAHNGTLTLGVSHNIVGGVMEFENGKNFLGAISLFRMWGHERTAEELRAQSCIIGNVVRWDNNDWDYQICLPEDDTNIQCGAFPNVTASPPTVTNTTPGSPTSTNTSDPVTPTETQQTPLGLPVSPTGLSTTKEPSDLNSTGTGIASTFYRVQMKLNMTMTVTGSDPGETIQTWVQRKLGEVRMKALHFQIFQSTYKGNDKKETQRVEMAAELRNQKRFRCTFHIQDADARNVMTTQRLINDLLSRIHFGGEIQVDSRDVHVSHIDPGSCPEDTHESIRGVYIWPIKDAQKTETMICEKNSGARASRKCELDGVTEKAKWAEPNLKACKPMITISDLDNVTVTANNSADVVDMIEDLLGVEGDLSDSQLATVVQKLDEVLGVSTVTPALGEDIVSIIADILGSSSNLSAVANDILGITGSVGDQMDFPEESQNVTVPSLALSMINVDPEQFQGLTFGVSSFSTGLAPEIFVNQTFLSQPCDGTVASISLPRDLQNFFPEGNKKKRVQFHFYGTQELFKDPETNWTLNSYVVSASVNNSNVSNLGNPVVVTLTHLKPKEKNDKVECVYWEFQKNNGSGGWDSNGCETLPSISAYQTTCHCYHLTHFGVLLDVSRTPISEADQDTLMVISYLGCGVSSIFLSISLLTYMVFEKLRRDYPSKILINLSVALLGLNLVFLMDSWLSSFGFYSLCIATAATLHYFLLASFTWMGLEAVHMYFSLVKVFNVYIPSYILKFCTLGWGIPLVVVSLVLAIEKDAYGNVLSGDSLDSLQGSEPFCWMQSNVFFYITIVAFVLLVLVFNMVVFIMVLIQIRHMQTNNPAATVNKRSVMHDLRAVASLTFLLGLTWPIAFFTWGPARVPMLHLFSVLNSLQGFFIFVFHCLMKENVRTQWRIHLCCGRFRLNDYSDWSRSVTMGGRTKQNHLVHRFPSVKSVNTSSRKISDDSTTASGSSSPPYHQWA
ncbi:adhesion G-protein coupled receptor G2-like [Oncorhynchus keta]|uniref:adhesion G-protein coupled receptor G2-like n=1 Tax=Oncorhynchus keta TaxID=8018 RepID=UPI0015F7E083|nr:adhesion G-protein coupled receptor G2-like [Oncorhynchus keta]